VSCGGVVAEQAAAAELLSDLFYKSGGEYPYSRVLGAPPSTADVTIPIRGMSPNAAAG